MLGDHRFFSSREQASELFAEENSTYQSTLVEKWKLISPSNTFNSNMSRHLVSVDRAFEKAQFLKEIIVTILEKW